jgi:UDP-N-acetyl-D-mannosaminuronate dehydrogenase
MIDPGLTSLLIGLGEIGKPLHNLLTRSGRVVGIDIEPVDVAERVGIMHICYPFLAQNSFVRTTLEYAKKYRPEIIVINSTVVPGTTAAIQRETQVPGVYSPVRGKHTKMESDLLHYRKFVGGESPDAVREVRNHFTRAGMKTQVVSSSKVLELAKLLETTYFGVLIAWAQEMERFAGEIDADYFEAAKFFEEIGYLPPVVFKPGYIGGHCVMSNIALLETLFSSEFLATIKSSNNKKALDLANQGLKTDERVEPVRIQGSN